MNIFTPKCPICNASLICPGPYMRDTLSYHFLRSECKPKEYSSDELDLSGFYPIDYMAVWLVILQIPSIKHIYISTPASENREHVVSALTALLTGKKSTNTTQPSQPPNKEPTTGTTLGSPGQNDRFGSPGEEGDPEVEGNRSITTVEVKVPMREKLTKTNIKNKAEKFSFALMTKMGKKCTTIQSEKPLLRSEHQTYSLNDSHKQAFIRIVQSTFSKPSVSGLMGIPFEAASSNTNVQLVIKKEVGIPFDIITPISLDECLKKIGVYLNKGEFDEQARSRFLEDPPVYDMMNYNEQDDDENNIIYMSTVKSDNTDTYPPLRAIRNATEDTARMRVISEDRTRNLNVYTPPILSQADSVALELGNDEPVPFNINSITGRGEQLPPLFRGYEKQGTEVLSRQPSSATDSTGSAQANEGGEGLITEIVIPQANKKIGLSSTGGHLELVESECAPGEISCSQGNDAEEEEEDIREVSENIAECDSSCINNDPVDRILVSSKDGLSNTAVLSTDTTRNKARLTEDISEDGEYNGERRSAMGSNLFNRDIQSIQGRNGLIPVKQLEPAVSPEAVSQPSGVESESYNFVTLSTLEKTEGKEAQKANDTSTGARRARHTTSVKQDRGQGAGKQRKTPSPRRNNNKLRRREEILKDPRIVKLKNDIETCIGKAYIRRSSSFVSRREMRLMSSLLLPSLESIDGKSFNKIERIDGPKIIKRNFVLSLSEMLKVDATPVTQSIAQLTNPSMNNALIKRARSMRERHSPWPPMAFNLYRIFGSKPALVVEDNTTMDKIMKKLKLTSDSSVEVKFEETIPQSFHNRTRLGRKHIKAAVMSKVLIPECYSLTRDPLPTPPSLSRTLGYGYYYRSGIGSGKALGAKGILREGFSMQFDLGRCSAQTFHPTLPYSAIGTRTGIAIVSIMDTAPEYLSRRIISNRQHFPWNVPVSLLVPSSASQFIPPWVTSIGFLSPARHGAAVPVGEDDELDGEVVIVGDRTGGLTCLRVEEMRRASLASCDSDWEDLSSKSPKYLMFKAKSPLFSPISSVTNIGFEIMDTSVVSHSLAAGCASGGCGGVGGQVVVSGYSKDICLYDVERNCVSTSMQNAHALPHIRTTVPNIDHSFFSLLQSCPSDVTDTHTHPHTGTSTINHTFMSFGSDCLAKLWDIRAPEQPCAEMYVSKTPILAAVSSRGTSLVGFASAGSNVGLLDANMLMHSKTIDLLNVPNIPTHCIYDKTCLAFLNRGKYLAVGSSGSSSIRVFDTSSGRITREMCIACSLPIRDLQLGGSGNPVCLGLTSGDHPHKLGILSGAFALNPNEPVDTDCLCSDLSIPKDLSQCGLMNGSRLG